MTFKTTHFAAGDLDKMIVQSNQRWMQRNCGPNVQAMLEKEKHAYTAWDGDEVIACFGITPLWTHRGFGWTFLSQDIGSRLRYVTKVCRKVFDECDINRIEAAVDCDFEQGHRWMKLLGMEMECERMASFYPNGTDCALYARVM